MPKGISERLDPRISELKSELADKGFYVEFQARNTRDSMVQHLSVGLSGHSVMSIEDVELIDSIVLDTIPEAEFCTLGAYLISYHWGDFKKPRGWDLEPCHSRSIQFARLREGGINAG